MKKSEFLLQGCGYMPLILTFRKLRQADFCELEASPFYILTFRLASLPVQLQDHVSEKKIQPDKKSIIKQTNKNENFKV